MMKLETFSPGWGGDTALLRTFAADMHNVLSVQLGLPARAVTRAGGTHSVEIDRPLTEHEIRAIDRWSPAWARFIEYGQEHGGARWIDFWRDTAHMRPYRSTFSASPPAHPVSTQSD